LTGDMMAEATARFTGKIARNWGLVTIRNLVGSIFIAYFFSAII